VSDRDSSGKVGWESPRLRATLIAFDELGRVLLVEHLRVRPERRYWVLPGGAVESGETIARAAAREVREELGVECEVGGLVAVGELITADRHTVDFFLEGKLKTIEAFTIRHEEGIGKAEWIEPSRLDEMLVLPEEIVPVLRGLSAGKRSGVTYLGKYKFMHNKLDLD